jgi:hypothetical protein
MNRGTVSDVVSQFSAVGLVISVLLFLAAGYYGATILVLLAAMSGLVSFIIYRISSAVCLNYWNRNQLGYKKRYF